MSGTMRYMEIACSNKPSNNLMSFRRGITEMIFDIPEMEGFVIPSSIRVCGNIRCYSNDAKDDITGTTVNMDARTGVYSTFNTITTRSLKHQTTIEQSRHFNRFMSSFIPLSSSLNDVQSHLNTTANTAPNAAQIKQGLVDMSKSSGTDFALAIPTGLLSGTGQLPLSSNWGLGGLQISIQLENDTQVFHSTTGNTDAAFSPFYEIENPHIICEVMMPDEATLAQLQKQGSGQLTYQSISSYYDTISSTNAQINFNLGLGKVRSAFVNFIDSSSLNNYKENGLATLMPTLAQPDGKLNAIQQVQFLKGGTQYPALFPQNNVIRDAKNTSVCDAGLIRDLIDAVVPYTSNRATCITTANANRNYVLAHAANGNTPYTDVADTGVVYGLSVRYDALGGSGADFRSQNWGLNMVLADNDGSVISAFIFVNSEQTLVYNANGVQVVQ